MADVGAVNLQKVEREQVRRLVIALAMQAVEDRKSALVANHALTVEIEGGGLELQRRLHDLRERLVQSAPRRV